MNTMELGIPGGVLLLPPPLEEEELLAPLSRPLPQAARAANSNAAPVTLTIPVMFARMVISLFQP
jgi:hypothetical protein